MDGKSQERHSFAFDAFTSYSKYRKLDAKGAKERVNILLSLKIS
jgi:hypothetical protein